MLQSQHSPPARDRVRDVCRDLYLDVYRDLPGFLTGSARRRNAAADLTHESDARVQPGAARTLQLSLQADL